MSVVRSWFFLFAGLFCALGLSVTVRAATLPSGFAETRVATGLASPTAGEKN